MPATGLGLSTLPDLTVCTHLRSSAWLPWWRPSARDKHRDSSESKGPSQPFPARHHRGYFLLCTWAALLLGAGKALVQPALQELSVELESEEGERLFVGETLTWGREEP